MRQAFPIFALTRNFIFSWHQAQLTRFILSTTHSDGKKYPLGAISTKALGGIAGRKGIKDSPDAGYIRLLDTHGDFKVNFAEKLT